MPGVSLYSVFIMNRSSLVACGRRSSRFPYFRIMAMVARAPCVAKTELCLSETTSHAHWKNIGRYSIFVSLLETKILFKKILENIFHNSTNRQYN